MRQAEHVVDHGREITKYVSTRYTVHYASVHLHTLDKRLIFDLIYISSLLYFIQIFPILLYND